MSRSNSLRLVLALLASVSLAAAAYAPAADDAKDSAKKDSATSDSPAGAKQASAFYARRRGKDDGGVDGPGEAGQGACGYEEDGGRVRRGRRDGDAAGGAAQKSKGKAKYAMIMGGRYLHADYAGETMGMPFHGSPA